MPHTPEQRDKQHLCGAKKKNGEKCRAFAGQGTDHPGIGTCKFHGGSTRTHKQHAVIQEAQRRMVKLGAPVEMRPTEALLAMLHLASGHVAWLRGEISRLDDLSSSEGLAFVALYGEERDRVAKVAKACLDAGVAERQVRLVEQYGSALASVLGAVFADPALHLRSEQRAALPEVLRRHLVAIEGGDSARTALRRVS